MSKLPKRIQAQLDQANAMLTAAEPAQAVAEPTPVVVEPQPEPVALVEPAPAAPTPAPAPTPAVQRDPEETWEHRYRTLQGMHNKNVEDLKNRLHNFEQQNRQMAAQLEALNKAAATPPTPDPKDVETFGQDLVEMVQRQVEHMLSRAAKQIDERLNAFEQKLTGTTKAVEQTAEEIFLSRLKEQVPNYAEINSNQDFLNWLAEIDDVYGLPRQSALTNAANALDVDRVAKVFKAFLATITPAPVSPAPAAPARTAASDLERQIAPSTVATAPTASAQTQNFTVSDVQAFYNDVRLGKYRGREQEAAEIEVRINRALAEGRIA